MFAHEYKSASENTFLKPFLQFLLTGNGSSHLENVIEVILFYILWILHL